mmetsp:Transcript_23098/g.53048  ORF Transcript_23098/g.53048 Transcript_23098/m.53048 type:complete len:268 (-) Transcript_23098:40-843(-)
MDLVDLIELGHPIQLLQRRSFHVGGQDAKVAVGGRSCCGCSSVVVVVVVVRVVCCSICLALLFRHCQGQGRQTHAAAQFHGNNGFFWIFCPFLLRRYPNMPLPKVPGGILLLFLLFPQQQQMTGQTNGGPPYDGTRHVVFHRLLGRELERVLQELHGDEIVQGQFNLLEMVVVVVLMERSVLVVVHPGMCLILGRGGWDRSRRAGLGTNLINTTTTSRRLRRRCRCRCCILFLATCCNNSNHKEPQHQPKHPAVLTTPDHHCGVSLV